MSKTQIVLRSLGINLSKPKNGMYSCPFPDHSDKTPSFSLDDNKGQYGAYHCFGCSGPGGKQGGNMVDFIKRYTGCDDKEAIKYYLNATGEGNTPQKFKDKKEFLESLPVLERVIKQSVALNESTAYLKERGIKKLPQDTLRYLNNEFYDKESKTLITKGSIIAPIYNSDNMLISLQSINPENKKQLDKNGNPYQEKQFLKNHTPKDGFTMLTIDEKSPIVILCEALIDGLSLNQIGYNAICCYNAHNLVNVAFAMRLVLRERAYVFADNDNLLGAKAKNEGLERALDASIILGGLDGAGDLEPKKKPVKSNGTKRCIVSWKYKDANDILLAPEGFKELKHLVASSISGNSLKNTLNGLLESKRLKLYLEQLNKCYVAHIDGVKLEDNKPANLATNLYTILVTKNIVARAYSDKEFNDNIKVIKQFSIENSNSYYAENYFPGRDYLSIQKQNNKDYLNVYEQSGLITKVKEYEEQEGDAKIFEALETYLLNLTNNEPEGYAFLIQLLAYRLQKPEIRHDYAVICFDKGGTGKSTFAKIMREILGENVSVSISQDNLQSQWNDYLKNKLMVFGEEVVGIAEKHNTSNNLKSVITDRELHVSERHKSNTYYNNFITLFLFSNDPEPIRITSDDRRYIVFEPIQSSEAIFDILHKDLKRTALVLAKYLTKIPLAERLKQYKNKSRQKLIGVSKNYIETLVDELSKNPREVLKNAQGKNKTNNKIPILEIQEFANEDYKPVQSQSIGTYVAEIKHKDGKDYLYMNGLLFYDLAKVLYDIKSNQRKVYQQAGANKLFTYHSSPVRVADKQVRGVSVELVKEDN